MDTTSCKIYLAVLLFKLVGGAATEILKCSCIYAEVFYFYALVLRTNGLCVFFQLGRWQSACDRDTFFCCSVKSTSESIEFCILT